MFSERACFPSAHANLADPSLSGSACFPRVHANLTDPSLLDLLMKGSVYFANSDEVVLQSDSPGALIYKYS